MTVLYNIKEIKLGGKSAQSIRSTPIPASEWLKTAEEKGNNWKSTELVTMAALKNIILSGARSIDYQYGDMVQYGTYYYDDLTPKELHYGMLLTYDTTDNNKLKFTSVTTTGLTARNELFITNNFTGIQNSKISSFDIDERSFEFVAEMVDTTLNTIIVSEAIDTNKINDTTTWTYTIAGNGAFKYPAEGVEIILPENSIIHSDYQYVLDSTTSTTEHQYSTLSTSEVQTNWTPNFKINAGSSSIVCTYNQYMKYDGQKVELYWVDSIDSIAPNGAYVLKYIV